MNTNIPDSPRVPNGEDLGPETTIPAQLGAELDLDSDVDSDENVPMEDVTVQNPVVRAQLQPESDNADMDMQLDSPFEVLDNPLMSEIPKDPNYITPMPDFSDPVRPIPAIVNPFGGNSTLSSSSPIPLSLLPELNISLVTDSQAQKLSEYVDDKLLSVQRGFVKYLSAREEDEIHEGLEWKGLVAGLDDIIEFLWYAMVMQKGAPVIYHINILRDDIVKGLMKDHGSDVIEQVNGVVKVSSNIQVKSEETPLLLPGNLGKTPYVAYLIRIMGDLIDYIVKYNFSSFTNWILLLRLLGKLDNIISVLIDYSKERFGQSTSEHIISTTEKIRIASIIQRTKIVVVELFDHFTRQMSTEEIAYYRQAIEMFQTFAGEVYEGLVDRTSG